jgi:hypothetical protein
VRNVVTVRNSKFIGILKQETVANGYLVVKLHIELQALQVSL